jgi:hypothetical protein
MEVPGAGGAPQGVTDVEVADAGPWLGGSARSLSHDLVVRGTGAGIPESATLGDEAPAPGSSSVMGPGISGLYLPSSPGSPPPPINWRRVGDEVESVYSQVTTVERLLHEMMASVHWNIMRPI